MSILKEKKHSVDKDSGVFISLQAYKALRKFIDIVEEDEDIALYDRAKAEKNITYHKWKELKKELYDE